MSGIIISADNVGEVNKTGIEEVVVWRGGIYLLSAWKTILIGVLKLFFLFFFIFRIEFFTIKFFGVLVKTASFVISSMNLYEYRKIILDIISTLASFSEKIIVLIHSSWFYISSVLLLYILYRVAKYFLYLAWTKYEITNLRIITYLGGIHGITPYPHELQRFEKSLVEMDIIGSVLRDTALSFGNVIFAFRGKGFISRNFFNGVKNPEYVESIAYREISKTTIYARN